MRRILCTLTTIPGLLIGCASQSKNIDSLLAVKTGQRLPEYLDSLQHALGGTKKSLVRYSAEESESVKFRPSLPPDVPLEADAYTVKLGGAATGKHLSRIFNSIKEICTSQYKGQLYTTEGPELTFSERYLHDVADIGMVDQFLLAKRFNPIDLNVLNAFWGHGALFAERSAKVFGFEKVGTWEQYPISVCASPANNGALYHFGMSFFTEYNNSQAPLYIAVLHNSEELKKLETSRLKWYKRKALDAEAEAKSNIVRYDGDATFHSLPAKVSLEKVDKRSAEFVFRVDLTNTTKSAVVLSTQDIGPIETEDGSRYEITLLEDFGVTRAHSSSACPTVGYGKQDVLINPGVKCTISQPVRIHGFGHSLNNIALWKGNIRLSLRPFSEYDAAVAKYSK